MLSILLALVKLKIKKDTTVLFIISQPIVYIIHNIQDFVIHLILITFPVALVILIQCNFE